MALPRSSTSIFLVALLLGLVGCASDGPAGQASVVPSSIPAGAEPPPAAAGSGSADGSVRVTKLATFPAMLTSFDASPDGKELLVGDREGVIRRMERRRTGAYVVPRLVHDPVLDLSAEVDSQLGERGFFDLKISNDGRWLVVNYTARNGDITVERFPYRTGKAVDRSAGTKLVVLRHPYAWHHGGGITFDDAGNLFMGIGDMEFRQIDPPAPQDPTLILGGVLKVPASAVSEARPTWKASPSDMVARGMRNPWRISIDRKTGDLWLGEVGLADIEEVDRIPAAELGTDVVNFGWPYLEGSRANQGTVPEGLDVRAPLIERKHGRHTCGVVGGFRYRGSALPGLDGTYLYSDLCGDTVRGFELGDGKPKGGTSWSGSAVDDRVLASIEEPPVSFGQDRAGELYLLGYNGGLYRIDPPSWRAPAADVVVDRVAPTTTTIPRSTLGCDGVVAAVEPLQQIAALNGEALRDSFAAANARLAEVVPKMPDAIHDDGILVQELFLQLQDRFAKAGWNPDSSELRGLRDDALNGTGIFVGFPDAMARIVDSECS